jgi:SAM-dependent methyltransferase
MSKESLLELFGSIDIYLFDQLSKGRLVPGMRVLDAVCGSGRNLVYFLRNGLASMIGVEYQVKLIDGRRYHLPDGSDRFLVDEVMLKRVTAALGGEFIEPIKTTVVENMRAMTTWVVKNKLRSHQQYA